MKFSTSLFRIPGPSSVAPSQLSSSDPTVAPHDDRAERGIAATTPSATATAPSAIAPGDPGERAFQRHRAGCPWWHARQRCDRQRAASERLADFARDRIAAAGRECRGERQARRLPDARRGRPVPAAIAATPVLAIALPGRGGRRVLRRCRGACFRRKPRARGQRRGDERDEQQRPSLPAERHENRDADDRAGTVRPPTRPCVPGTRPRRRARSTHAASTRRLPRQRDRQVRSPGAPDW